VEKEKILLNATLVFLIRGQYLLLAKKLKKIGQGCWNGYGGGIEGNETPEQCILRELPEEAKVTTTLEALQKVAIIDFHNTTAEGENFVCKVHVFFVHHWEGMPEATEEMGYPQWFHRNGLPVEEMMLADRIWLPIVLEGKKIKARAAYGQHQKTLLGEVIWKEVQDFSK